jgi:hypothetical protein
VERRAEVRNHFKSGSICQLLSKISLAKFMICLVSNEDPTVRSVPAG